MTEKTPVRRYQAVVIATALELWADKRIRVNRAYTPAAMMRTAGRILGMYQPAQSYRETAAKLREWAG
jgi:hypothetical protein